MKLWVPLMLAALVFVVHGWGSDRQDRYRDPPSRDDGYYGSRGYGHRRPDRGYYGGRRYDYGHGPPPPYDDYGHDDDGDKPLDALDKLFAEVDVLQDALKIGGQQLAGLEARLSLSKKFLDQLTIIDIPAFIVVDDNQDAAFNSLNDQLDDLMTDLNELDDLLRLLFDMNSDNRDRQETAENLWAEQRAMDINQEGSIAFLEETLSSFKETLLKTTSLNFQCVDNAVTTTKNILQITQNQEKQRMCEVGQVTLYADDRKAEYLFQTEFPVIPQVLFSICGYNFDLDADPRSYDNYYKQPNALGLSVALDPRRTGVKFEILDRSFGNTALSTVDVCFQACSIGPGTMVLPHPDLRMPMDVSSLTDGLTTP